jgi:predicted nuclease of predicted toxin-antitoxin system
MMIYLDDDSASALLARLLRQAGHDAQLPADIGLSGADDSVHLAHAIRQVRICLTGNHHDFENLHELVLAAQGHHPGILVVRKDNDRKRDLTASGIVKAIGNLLVSGTPIADNLNILNHWR